VRRETKWKQNIAQDVGKNPNKILGMITGKKVYALEDGDYCEKCAKIKVERDREEL